MGKLRHTAGECHSWSGTLAIIVLGLPELINTKEEKTVLSQTCEGFWGGWRDSNEQDYGFLPVFQKSSVLLLSLPRGWAGTQVALGQPFAMATELKTRQDVYVGPGFRGGVGV